MSEYIGPRMVPKPCGAWSATTGYGVLNIVLDEDTGDSYISKTTVPAGTEVTNEDYWALMSQWSQQVANLESNISEFVEAATLAAAAAATSESNAASSASAAATSESSVASFSASAAESETNAATSESAAADSASAAASDAAAAAAAAKTATDAVESIAGLEVDANTLGSSEDATAEVETTTDGNLKITFGIPQGIQGIQGEQGIQGIQGIQGEKGDTGSGFAILGYYDTLEALEAGQSGQEAGDAYGVGTEYPYDIYIWDGVNSVWVNNGSIQGAKGDTGTAATIEIGIVVTGDTGTEASVTNSGTASDAVFDFVLPRGEKGETGDQGESATVKVGTVTTGAEGSDATVTNSGTDSAVILNFTIPVGATGATGPQGEQGEQGETGETGATGPTGMSAYESAVAGGYTGTQDEFYVDLAAAASAGGGTVLSFNGRTGAVMPEDGDYDAEAVGALPIEGGTLLGALILAANPTADLGAATKAYVDESIQEAILDSWEASY